MTSLECENTMASLQDSNSSKENPLPVPPASSDIKRAKSSSPDLNARYFVAKCCNIISLRRCVATGRWASRERTFPPQPHDILFNAQNEGPVILIFSVNNCHGWHGYCRMGYQRATSIVHRTAGSEDSEESGARSQSDFAALPEESAAETNKHVKFGVTPKNFENDEGCMRKDAHIDRTDSGSNNQSSLVHGDVPTCTNETEANTAAESENLTKSEGKPAAVLHFFSVDWCTEFISCFGETCLPSSKTAQFCLLDGSLLNKARNWQEVSAEVGVEICVLLDQLHSSLVEKRRKAEEAKLAAKPAPFIHVEGDLHDGAGHYWRCIVGKVEQELGKVHLACPFGSQRYNVQQPNSDIDAFIVYQAHTKDLLGFDPPKLTIKNSDKETCDYTVLELKRYCELLLAYDARCIETLFLNDLTIIQASEEWRQLQKYRQQFLTRKCLDKYLGEALGSNGVQKFHRTIENSALRDDQCPPPYIAKLVYIIVRLLQNSVDIVGGGPLNVYRPSESTERNLLLKIRQGGLTVGEMKTIIQRLEEEIDSGKTTVTGETTSTKKDLESWLLSLRFWDIQTHPPLESNLP